MASSEELVPTGFEFNPAALDIDPILPVPSKPTWTCQSFERHERDVKVIRTMESNRAHLSRDLPLLKRYPVSCLTQAYNHLKDHLPPELANIVMEYRSEVHFPNPEFRPIEMLMAKQIDMENQCVIHVALTPVKWCLVGGCFYCKDSLKWNIEFTHYAPMSGYQRVCAHHSVCDDPCRNHWRLPENRYLTTEICFRDHDRCDCPFAMRDERDYPCDVILESGTYRMLAMRWAGEDNMHSIVHCSFPNNDIKDDAYTNPDEEFWIGAVSQRIGCRGWTYLATGQPVIAPNGDIVTNPLEEVRLWLNPHKARGDIWVPLSFVPRRASVHPITHQSVITWLGDVQACFYFYRMREHDFMLIVYRSKALDLDNPLTAKKGYTGTPAGIRRPVKATRFAHPDAEYFHFGRERSRREVDFPDEVIPTPRVIFTPKERKPKVFKAIEAPPPPGQTRNKKGKKSKAPAKEMDAALPVEDAPPAPVRRGKKSKEPRPAEAEVIVIDDPEPPPPKRRKGKAEAVVKPEPEPEPADDKEPESDDEDALADHVPSDVRAERMAGLWQRMGDEYEDHEDEDDEEDDQEEAEEDEDEEESPSWACERAGLYEEECDSMGIPRTPAAESDAADTGDVGASDDEPAVAGPSEPPVPPPSPPSSTLRRIPVLARRPPTD